MFINRMFFNGTLLVMEYNMCEIIIFIYFMLIWKKLFNKKKKWMNMNPFNTWLLIVSEVKTAVNLHLKVPNNSV